MVRAVAYGHLSGTLLEGDRCSKGTGSQVAKGQGICHDRSLPRKPQKEVLEATETRFKACFRMMGHQAGKPFIALLAKKQCPIQGMEARLPEGGGIAHVMQIGRSDQMPGSICREGRADGASNTSHSLNVKPPDSQRRKQLFGQADQGQEARLIEESKSIPS